MDREPYILDRFGRPIRPDHPANQPLSRTEKAWAGGALALALFSGGEGSFLSLYPMVGHPYWQTILAIQSAVFMFSGLALGVYVAVTHFTGVAWSLEGLLSQPTLWIFGLMLLLLTVLFGWQVKSSATLQSNLKTANAQITDLRNRSGPWLMTDDEKARLDSALAATKETYPLTIAALLGSGQSQEYSSDLAEVFYNKHWKVNKTIDLSLKADLVGLFLAVSPDARSAVDLPPETITMVKVLSLAKLKWTFMRKAGLNKTDTQLVVGAMPSDW